MQNRITNLMISHHALLEALFMVFRNETEKGLDSVRESLRKFKWEQSKHIFTEESAIFGFAKWKNKEMDSLIDHLKGEHRVILNMLEKFEDEIPQKDNGDLASLYKLMVEHRKEEEEKLYPVMETELNEDEKEQLISRINEIALRK